MPTAVSPGARRSRRAFGGALGATWLALAGSAWAHSGAGVVEPPELPPSLDLTLDDGSATNLTKLLGGRVTALQLMFTSCQATCPIQGALFAEGAKKLDARVKDAQWLSLTIDPKQDTPQALRAWMARFGAHPRWRALRPDPQKLDLLTTFLKSKNPGPDGHTAQVYFFDRRGRLVLRSVDFPAATELVRLLTELSARA